jgi:hypothetical protein
VGKDRTAGVEEELIGTALSRSRVCVAVAEEVDRTNMKMVRRPFATAAAAAAAVPHLA